ncbi:MAG: response regulator transcription factor, partial [Arcicella sp.]|nr:response regulator transcription factor [Arcicella sp.]
MKNNKIRVAIADDHAIFRRGIVSLLENNEDFEVVLQASNGQELIDNLEATRPEVILMDLQMPVLDGIRATKQI